MDPAQRKPVLLTPVQMNTPVYTEENVISGIEDEDDAFEEEELEEEEDEEM